MRKCILLSRFLITEKEIDSSFVRYTFRLLFMEKGRLDFCDLIYSRGQTKHFHNCLIKSNISTKESFFRDYRNERIELSRDTFPFLRITSFVFHEGTKESRATCCENREARFDFHGAFREQSSGIDTVVCER